MSEMFQTKPFKAQAFRAEKGLFKPICTHQQKTNTEYEGLQN